jgi:hypothetical protein
MSFGVSHSARLCPFLLAVVLVGVSLFSCGASRILDIVGHGALTCRAHFGIPNSIIAPPGSV